jgi:hypothetical protein
MLAMLLNDQDYRRRQCIIMGPNAIYGFRRLRIAGTQVALRVGTDNTANRC